MSQENAFCPKCQSDVAFEVGPSAKTCPVCGFQTRFHDGAQIHSQPKWGLKSWLGFLIVLAAPAAMSFAAVSTGEFLPARDEQLLWIAFGASGVSAVVCGLWAAFRLARRPGMRALLAVFLILAFYSACFVSCFAGCIAGQNLNNAL